MRKFKFEETGEEIILLYHSDNEVRKVIHSPLLFINWSVKPTHHEVWVGSLHPKVRNTLFRSKVYIDLLNGSASSDNILYYRFVGMQTRRKSIENKKVFGDVPMDNERYKIAPKLLNYDNIDFDLLETIPENGILHEGGNSDIHYKHYQ
jgi:hypothetical protein